MQSSAKTRNLSVTNTCFICSSFRLSLIFFWCAIFRSFFDRDISWLCCALHKTSPCSSKITTRVIFTRSSVIIHIPILAVSTEVIRYQFLLSDPSPFRLASPSIPTFLDKKLVHASWRPNTISDTQRFLCTPIAGHISLLRQSEHFGSVGRHVCWPNPTKSLLSPAQRSFGINSSRATRVCSGVFVFTLKKFSPRWSVQMIAINYKSDQRWFL